MKRAFTLIELLVVIAIIAILAAILFPVFSRAKESAKLSRAMVQMRQLSLSVFIYATDYDDLLVPATMRSMNPVDTPIIWTQPIEPYVKNKEIFTVDGQGAYAANWNERRQQPVGYSDATGVDPASTALPGSAPAGTEGFSTAAGFSEMQDVVRTGLFALTPSGPAGDTTSKHRGYVFNPYNGLNDPGGDYYKGLPKISDRNLVTEDNDPRYPGSPGLAPGQLKPIFCRYFADRTGAGRSPIIFADGHTKSHSSNELNVFGKVIWRFR